MADRPPARPGDQRPTGPQAQAQEQPSSGAASPSPAQGRAEEPPQPAGFSETVPGGRYIVDGQAVDADGRPTA